MSATHEWHEDHDIFRIDLFSWQNTLCHVVGTQYGIAILYDIVSGICSDKTRIIFAYDGRVYGRNLKKQYSSSWGVRLARQFASEMVARYHTEQGIVT